MGGLWQAAVMGFGGVRRVDEALMIDPHLPPEWPRLAFSICFRGARLRVEVSHDLDRTTTQRPDAESAAREAGPEAGAGDGPGREVVALEVSEAPVTLVLGRGKRRLAAGTHRFRRQSGGAWEELP